MVRYDRRRCTERETYREGIQVILATRETERAHTFRPTQYGTPWVDRGVRSCPPGRRGVRRTDRRGRPERPPPHTEARVWMVGLHRLEPALGIVAPTRRTEKKRDTHAHTSPHSTALWRTVVPRARGRGFAVVARFGRSYSPDSSRPPSSASPWSASVAAVRRSAANRRASSGSSSN
jgi:hypothetical protein